MRPRDLVWLLTAAGALAAAAPAGAAVKIEVLSNRADLVSGGDALVAVSAPARVFRDGTDVTSAFDRRPDGSFQGLVTDLRNGRNTLSAKLPDGSGAELTITNHQIGGPVLSGPQIQPWVCGTEDAGLGESTDAQCNAPTKVSYRCKSSSTGQFADCDPKS